MAPRTGRHHPLAPAQAIATGFGTTIVLGALVLMLPISSAGARWTGPVEALFTSTSAVCVTGLIVVDTAVYWSPFGKIVIMLLIQLGGLGIMLFAALVGIALARRLSVRSRLITSTETKSPDAGNVRRLAAGILATTLVIEGVVAVLLFLRFTTGHGYDPARAAWHAVFHAVSSFNNAGFALYSDSLMGFVTDPWITLPLCAATILGGLGFPVLRQLRRELRRPLHWTMNTRIVLVGTAALLAVGMLSVTVTEWDNPGTFGALDPASRLLAGFVYSVQARTAGFNSVDIAQLHDETWLITDVLMFIGAGPAGTAGGIKVTTFAVLFFIMWTELRGGAAVNVFGKRLSRAVHREAITVVLVAIAAVMAGVIAILAMTELDLDKVLFEAVSAFATVGLSTGITADLPAAAKLILVALMFLGRLGPLTLGSALALRERRIAYELPKERPAIG
ncbi:TrkH family potassium uptake protein [Microbacterium neungamense]|uniref:TrkH family potassium uptake protein n=1 Tax=Microbacterium TaxID=33882 RepID=UPI00217E7C96|nr:MULTISPECIES: TrkH family potassium uptake protein [Microbacterium]UWF78564.1 TrkH family potassium uptake protein [Microbacterium neungamense]WCM56740.1 TrkH family potassium uptake protein [Microbacterium sp. EF45047]